MNKGKRYSNWVDIDLGAIESNINFIQKRTSAEVMAIVKANGYGHGSVPVAKAALRGGATWCGVAQVNEALELRKAGLDCPLLLLGFTPPDRFSEAISNHVSITVWNSKQIEAISKLEIHATSQANLHLKVDTGMSRLGVQPDGVIELAQRMANDPKIQFEGIFTHFACADELDKSPTDIQETLFRKVLEELISNDLLPPLVSASNSAACLNRPSANFNMVRPGISIYGLHPSPDCLNPESIKPALSWKSVLSQVKSLPPGRGISYGHRYTTQSHERIGTIPVGYADGYRRTKGNQILVGGSRAPVIGRVNMDQIMVNLDTIPEAKEGDEVVLIGAQGSEQITVEDLASLWGTNNYEVVCGIGYRVPRVYF
jgi:alanine racemase